MNSAKFPEMKFTSLGVKKISDDSYEITGELTILSTTKKVVFPFNSLGESTDMQGKARRGGEAEFTIRRSEYGMKESLGPVGDEVKIMLAFSGVKQ